MTAALPLNTDSWPSHQEVADGESRMVRRRGGWNSSYAEGARGQRLAAHAAACRSTESTRVLSMSNRTAVIMLFSRPPPKHPE